VNRELKELKKLAMIGSLNPNPSPLPRFVGDEVFISPNIRRDIVTDEKTNDHLVKAWNIPSLIGLIIISQNELDVGKKVDKIIQDLGLENIKSRRFRGKEKDVFDIVPPLRKYHILHVQITSDYLSEFSKPMFLEIYGRIISIGGFPQGSKEAKEIHDNHGGLHTPIDAPIEIEIEDAKWSNISNPTGISYL